MMTRQPAIELGFFLSMTVYTESHLKVNRDQPVIPLHVPVAGGAINAAPDMGLMTEFDMVGDVKDPDPGDRGQGIEISSLLHDFRVLGDDVGMTEEAEPYRRDAGVPGAFRVGMAESAADLFDAGMNPVAKKDGLLRADGLLGMEVVEIDHPRKE